MTVDQVDDDGKPLKWKTAGTGSASIDKTLTKSGYAADAKIVGDSLSQLEQKVGDKIGETELSEAVEYALTVAKESGQFDGKDGQDGQNGTDGKDGTSVSVQSVVESTEDGGANVVTFSDGKQVTVHNGSKGSTGATGAAGQDGISPHIGENGNWWIGTTDTNVSAAGGSYTLPTASSTILGGVKPIAKTDAMTQGVGVDAAGALWTTPGAGSDLSLGLTSAQVGQIAKITAVDDGGKPTAWEAVDFVSAGDEWEVIETISLSEDVQSIVLNIVADYKKVYLIGKFVGAATNDRSDVNGKLVVDGFEYFFNNNLQPKNGNTRWVVSCVEVLPNIKKHLTAGNNNNSYMTATWPSTGYFGTGGAFSSVEIRALGWNTSGENMLLGAGTEITLYGVRA